MGTSFVLAAGMMTIAGCESSSREGSKRLQVQEDPQSATAKSETWRGRTARLREQPAPAPVAAVPLPAPAPSGCSMYFPTGDRATSSIFVSKSAPSEVVSGVPFDYEIRVENLTPASLDNVVLTDNMQGGFKLNASNPQAESGAGGLIRWNIGTLAPREVKTIKATGLATATSGTISGCASVTYSNSLCCSVNVVQPALKLVKTAPAEINCPNDLIPVRLVVTNTGSGLARNVVVRDPLPAGLTSDGKQELSFQTGNLGPGQSRDYSFNIRASKTGSYTNTASATADGGLTASAATTTMVRQPVLTLRAECPPNNMIGRNLVYKFTVTNTGDAPCSGTVLGVSIPANATFVSADNAGAAAGARANWSLGAINARESRTVTMTLRSTGAGEIPVTASVNCGCAGPITADCRTSIQGVPDIGTLVTDDDGVVSVGDPHTYRVEVKNQGQVNLTNVKMIVTMPAGMEFVSSPVGRVVAGNKVEFDFTTLGPGAIKQSSFVVRTTKSGEFLVVGDTTCAELKTPVRDDEFTNFIDR
jgi:uncharacterized repeat protein (TIGR01451 family)